MFDKCLAKILNASKQSIKKRHVEPLFYKKVKRTYEKVAEINAKSLMKNIDKYIHSPQS